MKTKLIVYGANHRNKVLYPKKKHYQEETHIQMGNMHFQLNPDHFQITHRYLWYTLWIVRQYCTTYYFPPAGGLCLPVPHFVSVEIPDGISREEAGPVFNQNLMKTYLSAGKNPMEDWHFWVSVATACGMGYTIYVLTKILKLVSVAASPVVGS